MNKTEEVVMEEEVVKELEEAEKEEVVKELEEEEAEKEEVVKELEEAENTTKTVVKATGTVEENKVKRERYNEELDKRILDLDGQKKSITEIAKEIERSYASTTYRLRKLRGKNKDVTPTSTTE